MKVEKMKRASNWMLVDVDTGGGKSTASLVMSKSFDCTQEAA